MTSEELHKAYTIGRKTAEAYPRIDEKDFVVAVKFLSAYPDYGDRLKLVGEMVKGITSVEPSFLGLQIQEELYSAILKDLGEN